MSKDPAFLFYPGDWLGGTMTFTRHQKGCYHDLLMAQFSEGHLTLEDVKTVLGVDFELHWEIKLKAKFQVDSQGRFYNKKLEDEINKRKNFTESRRSNRAYKKEHMNKHMINHMTSHMENGNENENKDINTTKTLININTKFIPPTIQEVTDFIKIKNINIDPIAFHAHYEANGWMRGRNKIKNWKACVTTWVQRDKLYMPSRENKPEINRPQVDSLVLVGIASKWDSRMIKAHCIDRGYSEHEIDEAIMRLNGKKI